MGSAATTSVPVEKPAEQSQPPASEEEEPATAFPPPSQQAEENNGLGWPALLLGAIGAIALVAICFLAIVFILRKVVRANAKPPEGEKPPALAEAQEKELESQSGQQSEPPSQKPAHFEKRHKKKRRH